MQSLEGQPITSGVSGGIDTDGDDFRIYQATYMKLLSIELSNVSVFSISFWDAIIGYNLHFIFINIQTHHTCSVNIFHNEKHH